MLPSYGLSKMFVKAGIPGWKAFVPFYNTWVMQEKAERPKYWAILQLIPIAGWFITMGIFIEWVKLFASFRWVHMQQVLLYPSYIFLTSHRKKIRVILVLRLSGKIIKNPAHASG